MQKYTSRVLIAFAVSSSISFAKVKTESLENDGLTSFNEEILKNLPQQQYESHLAVKKKLEKLPDVRQPASDKGYEELISPLVKNKGGYRERILNLKPSVNTPDGANGLDTILKELDEKYASYASEKANRDLAFFAAQTIPMRTMRGIVWRLIPALREQKALHSATLSIFRSLAAGLKIFLPLTHLRVGFDYLTQPYTEADGKLVAQFNNEVEIQGYLTNTVIPAITTAITRINALDMSDNLVVWDNRMIFGVESFTDKLDQYKMIGEPERLMVMSGLYSALSQLSFQRAYSAKGSFALAAETGKLYGFDGFSLPIEKNFKDLLGKILPEEKLMISGVSSNDRAELIHRKNVPWNQLGRARKDASDWLRLSWTAYQQSVFIANSAWGAMKHREANRAFFMDTSWANVASYVSVSDSAMKDLVDLANGKDVTIKSVFDNDTTVVNLQNFYLSAKPLDDLKAFFPNYVKRNASPSIQFGNEWKEMKLANAKSVYYRDYFNEGATDWNVDAYKYIFPDVTTVDQLKQKIRTISRSYSGAPLAGMLSGFFY